MRNRQRILFSCVGTTDPARGQHDGGLMHIARHYRPAAICIFISKEMEKNIPYYDKMFEIMRDKWGYTPEVQSIKSGITDPSNLDGLYEPMGEAFAEFSRAYPDAEILINLSSGTPQMEIILSQLALSVPGRGTGIQVKTPERKAGTAKRANDPTYNPNWELENNLDEEPGAENRCVRPKLFAIRRERQWGEVQTLLERRDYAAILERRDAVLSPELLDIVRHLNTRALLDDTAAREIAARLPEELNLYPCGAGLSGAELSRYWEVIDYWLMMKNLLHTGRYSDFLLRLSVLALYLEEAQLKTLFAQRGIFYNKLMEWDDRKQDYVMSMKKLETHAPDVYGKLCEIVKKQIKALPQDERNVFLYTRLLRCMDTPKRLMKFFNLCDNLSGQRNHLAHRLRAVSEEDFRKAAQIGKVETFEKEIETIIQAVYPSSCDPAVFTLYDRCVKYIADNR